MLCFSEAFNLLMFFINKGLIMLSKTASARHNLCRNNLIITYFGFGEAKPQIMNAIVGEKHQQIKLSFNCQEK